MPDDTGVVIDPRPEVPALFDTSTELGRALDGIDWAATALGPVASWPASLRNVLRLMLGSRFAMWMAWGPELTFFCNDAYRVTTLGAKYPWALGKPADEVWSEIWPDIGPRILSVVQTGAATWDESLLLFLERSGYQEETYHTFSYSPITDDAGAIAGMLCVVSEETARVVGELRMTTVRDLSAALAAAITTADVLSAAGRCLAADPRSLPFTLGYLLDAGSGCAELAWSSGVEAGSGCAPHVIALDDATAVWPAADVVGRQPAMRVVDLRAVAAGGAAVPAGAWPEPPTRAVLAALTQPGMQRPFGFLVAALNRYRPFDDGYRGFLQLIAGQVAAAIVRARAYEQERRRAEELAELDRAKTTFFTNVSHELRTPLTLLLGPAEDALHDASAPLEPAQRDRVEVIRRNAERLLKLVNTLLDFSRLESGRAQARYEPIDLMRYTADLAAMFESALRRAGLELTIDVRPLSQRPYVDREMWAKIVLNLLSNALKATFEGGITVRLAEHDGQAVLSVQDTGIGIPEAEQQRLFERFHRVSGARLRTFEGSGIGLALVAELADLHGGSVEVDSAPGTGSTFTVRVPLGTAHLPADAVVHEAEQDSPEAARYSGGYLAEAGRWLADDAEAAAPTADTQAGGAVADSGATVVAPAAARPEHGRGAGGASVLVVDDNADMRAYVAGLLRPEYVVRTAADGLAGLESARATPPDLVLTDVMMPRLDGFGLLAELRADPQLLHVPVIMLSARAGDEAAVTGLEAGANDYLVKPFAARELLARVRANLELDRVRRVADELARSRALLDQAEEFARVGSWQIDLRDRHLTVSAQFLRIVGLEAAALSTVGVDGLLQLVVEEDRAAVSAQLERAMAGVAPLELETTIVRPDGERPTIRVRGGLGAADDTGSGAPGSGGPGAGAGAGVGDGAGDDAAVHLRGSVQDVTDQRAAQRALALAALAQEAAAREHQVADQLQRSLLPVGPANSEHLHVAAYYRAGTEGTQAGGDWYDVIDLGGDRTALVIGDVMGRGVRAAAVMGQLRAAVRAYARIGLEPGALLGHLDSAVGDLDESMIVTCIYAVHDPHAGTLTYANAGHLPPLLAAPGSGARRLDVGDPPLGTGAYGGHTETVPWSPADRLVLYTDGLVEHRGSDIDTGIDRLAKVLTASEHPVEALPNAAVDSLLPHEPDDDVAVLAAALRDPRRDREISLALPADPTAVATAREAAATAFARWGVDEETAFDAGLIVSELVTNAIRYGRPPVELRVRADQGRLIVDVFDGGTDLPRATNLDPGAPNGRGLFLIDSLGEERGVRPTGNGKSVWCLIRVRPAAG